MPISLPTYAIMGAAATLGGATRMTLSITVLVMETTGGLQLVMPLMLTIFVAKTVGDYFGCVLQAQKTANLLLSLSRQPASLDVSSTPRRSIYTNRTYPKDNSTLTLVLRRRAGQVFTTHISSCADHLFLKSPDWTTTRSSYSTSFE